jgi:hypothetical protein
MVSGRNNLLGSYGSNVYYWESVEMRVTVIKGVIQDRLIVGFWIGVQHQNVIVSITELTHIMNQEDIDIIAKSPVGVWEAKVNIKLGGAQNERH